MGFGNKSPENQSRQFQSSNAISLRDFYDQIVRARQQQGEQGSGYSLNSDNRREANLFEKIAKGVMDTGSNITNAFGINDAFSKKAQEFDEAEGLDKVGKFAEALPSLAGMTAASMIGEPIRGFGQLGEISGADIKSVHDGTINADPLEFGQVASSMLDSGIAIASPMFGAERRAGAALVRGAAKAGGKEVDELPKILRKYADEKGQKGLIGTTVEHALGEEGARFSKAIGAASQIGADAMQEGTEEYIQSFAENARMKEKFNQDEALKSAFWGAAGGGMLSTAGVGANLAMDKAFGRSGSDSTKGTTTGTIGDEVKEENFSAPYRQVNVDTIKDTGREAFSALGDVIKDTMRPTNKTPGNYALILAPENQKVRLNQAIPGSDDFKAEYETLTEEQRKELAKEHGEQSFEKFDTMMLDSNISSTMRTEYLNGLLEKNRERGIKLFRNAARYPIANETSVIKIEIIAYRDGGGMMMHPVAAQLSGADEDGDMRFLTKDKTITALFPSQLFKNPTESTSFDMSRFPLLGPKGQERLEEEIRLAFAAKGLNPNTEKAKKFAKDISEGLSYAHRSKSHQEKAAKALADLRIELSKENFKDSYAADELIEDIIQETTNVGFEPEVVMEVAIQEIGMQTDQSIMDDIVTAKGNQVEAKGINAYDWTEPNIKNLNSYVSFEQMRKAIEPFIKMASGAFFRIEGALKYTFSKKVPRGNEADIDLAIESFMAFLMKLDFTGTDVQKSVAGLFYSRVIARVNEATGGKKIGEELTIEKALEEFKKAYNETVKEFKNATKGMNNVTGYLEEFFGKKTMYEVKGEATAENEQLVGAVMRVYSGANVGDLFLMKHGSADWSIADTMSMQKYMSEVANAGGILPHDSLFVTNDEAALASFWHTAVRASNDAKTALMRTIDQRLDDNARTISGIRAAHDAGQSLNPHRPALNCVFDSVIKLTDGRIWIKQKVIDLKTALADKFIGSALMFGGKDGMKNIIIRQNILAATQEAREMLMLYKKQQQLREEGKPIKEVEIFAEDIDKKFRELKDGTMLGYIIAQDYAHRLDLAHKRGDQLDLSKIEENGYTPFVKAMIDTTTSYDFKESTYQEQIRKEMGEGYQGVNYLLLDSIVENGGEEALAAVSHKVQDVTFSVNAAKRQAYDTLRSQADGFIEFVEENVNDTNGKKFMGRMADFFRSMDFEVNIDILLSSLMDSKHMTLTNAEKGLSYYIHGAHHDQGVMKFCGGLYALREQMLTHEFGEMKVEDAVENRSIIVELLFSPEDNPFEITVFDGTGYRTLNRNTLLEDAGINTEGRDASQALTWTEFSALLKAKPRLINVLAPQKMIVTAGESGSTEVALAKTAKQMFSDCMTASLQPSVAKVNSYKDISKLSFEQQKMFNYVQWRLLTHQGVQAYIVAASGIRPDMSIKEQRDRLLKTITSLTVNVVNIISNEVSEGTSREGTKVKRNAAAWDERIKGLFRMISRIGQNGSLLGFTHNDIFEFFNTNDDLSIEHFAMMVSLVDPKIFEGSDAEDIARKMGINPDEVYIESLKDGYYKNHPEEFDEEGKLVDGAEERAKKDAEKNLEIMKSAGIIKTSQIKALAEALHISDDLISLATQIVTLMDKRTFIELYVQQGRQRSVLMSMSDDAEISRVEKGLRELAEKAYNRIESLAEKTDENKQNNLFDLVVIPETDLTKRNEQEKFEKRIKYVYDPANGFKQSGDKDESKELQDLFETVNNKKASESKKAEALDKLEKIRKIAINLVASKNIRNITAASPGRINSGVLLDSDALNEHLEHAIDGITAEVVKDRGPSSVIPIKTDLRMPRVDMSTPEVVMQAVMAAFSAKTAKIDSGIGINGAEALGDLGQAAYDNQYECTSTGELINMDELDDGDKLKLIDIGTYRPEGADPKKVRPIPITMDNYRNIKGNIHYYSAKTCHGPFCSKCSPARYGLGRRGVVLAFEVMRSLAYWAQEDAFLKAKKQFKELGWEFEPGTFGNRAVSKKAPTIATNVKQALEESVSLILSTREDASKKIMRVGEEYGHKLTSIQAEALSVCLCRSVEIKGRKQNPETGELKPFVAVLSLTDISEISQKIEKGEENILDGVVGIDGGIELRVFFTPPAMLNKKAIDAVANAPKDQTVKAATRAMVSMADLKAEGLNFWDYFESRPQKRMAYTSQIESLASPSDRIAFRQQAVDTIGASGLPKMSPGQENTKIAQGDEKKSVMTATNKIFGKDKGHKYSISKVFVRGQWANQFGMNSQIKAAQDALKGVKGNELPYLENTDASIIVMAKTARDWEQFKKEAGPENLNVGYFWIPDHIAAAAHIPPVDGEFVSVDNVNMVLIQRDTIAAREAEVRIAPSYKEIELERDKMRLGTSDEQFRLPVPDSGAKAARGSQDVYEGERVDEVEIAVVPNSASINSERLANKDMIRAVDFNALDGKGKKKNVLILPEETRDINEKDLRARALKTISDIQHDVIEVNDEGVVQSTINSHDIMGFMQARDANGTTLWIPIMYQGHGPRKNVKILSIERSTMNRGSVKVLYSHDARVGENESIKENGASFAADKHMTTQADKETANRFPVVQGASYINGDIANGSTSKIFYGDHDSTIGRLVGQIKKVLFCNLRAAAIGDNPATLRYVFEDGKPQDRDKEFFNEFWTKESEDPEHEGRRNIDLLFDKTNTRSEMWDKVLDEDIISESYEKYDAKTIRLANNALRKLAYYSKDNNVRPQNIIETIKRTQDGGYLIKRTTYDEMSYIAILSDLEEEEVCALFYVLNPKITMPLHRFKKTNMNGEAVCMVNPTNGWLNAGVFWANNARDLSKKLFQTRWIPGIIASEEFLGKSTEEGEPVTGVEIGNQLKIDNAIRNGLPQKDVELIHNLCRAESALGYGRGTESLAKELDRLRSKDYYNPDALNDDDINNWDPNFFLLRQQKQTLENIDNAGHCYSRECVRIVDKGNSLDSKRMRDIPAIKELKKNFEVYMGGSAGCLTWQQFQNTLCIALGITWTEGNDYVKISLDTVKAALNKIKENMDKGEYPLGPFKIETKSINDGKAEERFSLGYCPRQVAKNLFESLPNLKKMYEQKDPDDPLGAFQEDGYKAANETFEKFGSIFAQPGSAAQKNAFRKKKRALQYAFAFACRSNAKPIPSELMNLNGIDLNDVDQAMKVIGVTLFDDETNEYFQNFEKEKKKANDLYQEFNQAKLNRNTQATATEAAVGGKIFAQKYAAPNAYWKLTDVIERLIRFMAMLNPGVIGGNVLETTLRTAALSMNNRLVDKAYKDGQNPNWFVSRLWPTGEKPLLSWDKCKELAALPGLKRIYQAMRTAKHLGVEDDFFNGLVTADNIDEYIDEVYAGWKGEGRYGTLLQWGDRAFELLSGNNKLFTEHQLAQFLYRAGQLYNTKGIESMTRTTEDGTSEMEKQLVANPAGFMARALSNQFAGWRETLNAFNQADNVAMSRENSVSLIIKELCKHHPTGSLAVTIFISPFVRYMTNMNGRVLNFILPMSSLNYLLAHGMLNSKNQKVKDFALDANLDIGVLHTSLKAAFMSDMLHFTVPIMVSLVGMLIAAGVIEPPDDENKKVNFWEWLIMGKRIESEWWLVDILGPVLPMACFMHELTQNGNINPNILINGFADILSANPLIKVADLVDTVFYADSFEQALDNQSISYIEASGEAPNSLEVAQGLLANWSITTLGRITTPSFLREWARTYHPFEKSYKRIWQADVGEVDPDQGEIGKTDKVGYVDAMIRKATKDNPLIAGIGDFFNPTSTSLFNGGNQLLGKKPMPNTTYYDYIQLMWSKKYSVNNEDGTEKTEEEKLQVAQQVIATLQQYSLDELKEYGFMIDTDTRLYVTSIIRQASDEADAMYKQWYATADADNYVLGAGDFNAGKAMNQEIREAFDKWKNSLWKDLYYGKLNDEYFTNGVQKYYRENTDYARDAKGDIYATGFRKNWMSLLPVREAEGTRTNPGSTAGYEGDWSSLSAINEKPLGERALVPIPKNGKISSTSSQGTDKIDTSGHSKGNSYEISGINKLLGVDLESLLPVTGATSSSKSGSRRYGSRGGGGGGGGSSAPNIYSRYSNVNGGSPRTSGSANMRDASLDYLRPNFETKGSREASRRSDF